MNKNKKDETLYDKAVQNLNCAVILYNSDLSSDEAYLNYVGYHIQQAVELSMKFILEENGIEYKYSHDIEQIIQLAQENNVDLFVTDYIYDKAEMFSSWEAKTRYIKNYKLERNKVSKAITEVNKYFDIIDKHRELFMDKDITDDHNDTP